MATTPPSPAQDLAPPPSPKKPEPRTIAIVAAIVVVVVVIAGLILTGIIPLIPGSSSSTGPSTSSYMSAESSAASFSRSVPGGPWSLVAVEGLDLVSSYSNSTIPAGCTVTGGSGTLSFGAYTGNYSNGLLSNWLFVYTNASLRGELAVQVSGGHTSEIGVITGSSSCHPNFALNGAIPTHIEDSTQIASALLGQAAVDSFVHTYATANAGYLLLNEGPYGGTQWSVAYSGCPLLGFGRPVATGAEVAGVLNASTGALVNAVVSLPASHPCPGGPSSTPIGSAFFAGNPVLSTCAAGDTWATNGCVAGDHVYILTIEISTITLSDVAFEVRTPVGAVADVPGAQGFSIWNITGGTVARSSAPSPVLLSSVWSYAPGSHFNGTTPLTTLYTIWIDMGTTNPSGLGYSFVALGQGQFGGMTAPLGLP